MNTLPVLIRREIWEHRVLWMAPLAVSVLYVLLCFLPNTGVNMGGIDIAEAARAGSPERPVIIFTAVQMVLMGVFYVLMSIVAFFYLSDCLYAERKDRSILFWKSLPVSDTETVLSKLLVALIVLPLGVYVLALITNLAAFGILFTRFGRNPALDSFMRWDTVAWVRLNALLLADVFVFALWFAPVAACQMLISAWAKSSVFLWTVLPPIVLILAERLVFGTTHTGQVLAYRLGSFVWDLAGHRGFGLSAGAHASGLEDVLAGANALPMLTWPSTWIGVAVAAALIFATIRIRRYRDES